MGNQCTVSIYLLPPAVAPSAFPKRLHKVPVVVITLQAPCTPSQWRPGQRMKQKQQQNALHTKARNRREQGKLEVSHDQIKYRSCLYMLPEDVVRRPA